MFQIIKISDGNYEFKGEILISSLEEFYDFLSNIKKNDSAVTFDLGELTAMDSAAIQLFVSFKKSNICSDIKFVNANDRITKYIKLTGLYKYFF